jgi:hypothetical protein
MLDIVAISLGLMQVATNEGDILPIVDLLDEFGDYTLDVHETASAVAGPDKNGQWWLVVVDDFSTETKRH